MPTSIREELLTCIPELRRYAFKLTGERSAAEDLVQDCLERALRNVDKFAPGTNLEAWLTTILKHLFFTEHQRCRRRPKVELDEQDCAVPPPQISHIAFHEVGEAIRALPSHQRHLIQMVTIDGVSYQDAADRLGVPVGTIRSRLSRAREQIRHNLEQRGRPMQSSRPCPVPPLPRDGSTPPPPVPVASSNTPCAAPGPRRPRPSALPACVAALRRSPRRGGRVPHIAQPARQVKPRRGPARVSVRTRGPPATQKRFTLEAASVP